MSQRSSTDTLQIKLVVMPNVHVTIPSLSLTQLQAVIRATYGERVDIEILYLNHAFAIWMEDSVVQDGSGQNLYDIFNGNQMHNTGLGDWFFRQVAFPELEDNATEYMRRYYPAKNMQAFREALLEKRRGLTDFLNGLADLYDLEQADIVGFSSMFAQNVACLGMAHLLKARRPEQTILFGGANCEYPMGYQLAKNAKSVDYVFSGLGLKSFPEFVGYHLDGEPEKCASIKGVFNRDSPRPAPDAMVGEELPIDDEAPLNLDYDGYFESFEKCFPDAAQKPIVFFETSRGCWWGAKAHCTFCGLNSGSMHFRTMPAKLAIRLMNDLFERYQGRSDYFLCVDNIMPLEHVKDVLPFVKAPVGSDLFYEVKANLDEHDFEVLSTSGVSRIQPGIESLASSTLRLMKKGTTVFTNLELLKNCLRFDVNPQWNLLVGFPGEPDEVYDKYEADLPRLLHLYPPDGTFPVRFDRYSPYYMQREEYGLDLHCYDYYSLIYPYEQEALEEMAYYFMDLNYDAEYFTTMVRHIVPLRKVVGDWLERWGGIPGSQRTGRRDDWVQPKLYVSSNGTGGVVHDSRSGQAVEHDIGAPALKVLEALDKPKRSRDLEVLAGELGVDLEAQLAALDERGLVWQENGRYLSLVLPEEY
jgi:ribosomal peptide maturation radical SAM protein 1